MVVGGDDVGCYSVICSSPRGALQAPQPSTHDMIGMMALLAFSRICRGGREGSFRSVW
jgi:hypothetical protein